VGGSSGTEYLNSVEVLDGTSWSAGPPLATARSDFGLASHNGTGTPGLYAVGGISSAVKAVLNSVEVLDGTSWSPGPDLTTARLGFGLASYDGSLYAVGGFDKDNNFLKSVEVFDGTSWSAGPSLTTARRDVGLASYDGSLYAVGGWSGSKFLGSVEVFNGTSWSAGPSLNAARGYFGLASHNGLLYAVGGMPGYSSVEVFNGTSWSTLETSLTIGRVNFGLASHGGLLYAVGGQDSSGTKLDSVEVFNGTSWRAGPDLYFARSRFGLASL
jgi:hypothetical protein